MPKRGETGLTTEEQVALILREQAALRQEVQKVLRELGDMKKLLVTVYNAAQRHSFDDWFDDQEKERRRREKLPFQR